MKLLEMKRKRAYSLVIAAGIALMPFVSIYAKPEDPVVTGTACEAKATFGARCNQGDDCPEGTNPYCKGGLFTAKCGCETAAQSLEFNINEVNRDDLERAGKLWQFLQNYGTSEAHLLAEHVAVLILAVVSDGDYSTAEHNYSDTYAASSATLKAAIEDAVARDDWNPWHRSADTYLTCDASITGLVRQGDFDFPVALEGPATFGYTAISSPGDEPAWAELASSELRHTSSDDLDIILEIDPSRSTISRIESVNGVEPFPASSTLRFHAYISSEQLGFNRIRSINEIVIENLDLTSWPHDATVYTQVGETSFEDPEHPGHVVLVLSNAEVTVTAHR